MATKKLKPGSSEVNCTNCGKKIIKIKGRSTRYHCYNDSWSAKTFMLEYHYKTYVKGAKEQTIEMAVNDSGMRDNSRVLGTSKPTIISALQNTKSCLVQVNLGIKILSLSEHSKVSVCLVCAEAKIDAQWSLVSKESNQCWLWHTTDHAASTLLALTGVKTRHSKAQSASGSL